MELETLRAYATALGGHVDITVSVGPHTIKVAWLAKTDSSGRHPPPATGAHQQPVRLGRCLAGGGVAIAERGRSAVRPRPHLVTSQGARNLIRFRAF